MYCKTLISFSITSFCSILSSVWTLNRLGILRPLCSSKGNTFDKNLVITQKTKTYIIRSPRKALYCIRDALLKIEFTIARIWSWVLLMVALMNGGFEKSCWNDINTFHSFSHSLMGVISNRLKKMRSGVRSGICSLLHKLMANSINLEKGVSSILLFCVLISWYISQPTIWNAREIWGLI